MSAAEAHSCLEWSCGRGAWISFLTETLSMMIMLYFFVKILPKVTCMSHDLLSKCCLEMKFFVIGKICIELKPKWINQ